MTPIWERARAAKDLLSSALEAEPPRLDSAILAIAAIEYPELDAESCERTLSELAARVRAKKPGNDPVAQLEALRVVLAEEEGFRGNREHYQDPENSFLNRVLERHIGLPISLSVVYLQVARRAKVPLYGVAFPGHFLVAADLDQQQKVVLDPFNDGASLDEASCE